MISEEFAIRTTDPYSLVESWWGEPLDASLGARITSAPRAQMEQFIDYVETQIDQGILPELTPGALRPLLKRQNCDETRGRSPLSYLDSALSLLLYADEVIVEDPTRYLKDKDNIPEIVDALIRMRPLAKAGLIHFFRFSNRLHHPSRSFNITAVDAEKLRLLPDGTELIREMDRLSAILRSYDFELLIFQVRMALGISLVLARDNPRSFNVLARSAEESVLLPVGLYNAALSSSDTRNICMARLASLTLPKLDGKAVWSVRKSSDEFGEWRQALGVAMREIDAISSDDEAWQSEARGIFEWELRSIRDKLNRTTQKSSALSVAKVGTINMTYSAVGALTGFALGGNIGTALAGAASAKGTEVIVSYLRGLKERRQGKAILDLALAFHSNDD